MEPACCPPPAAVINDRGAKRRVGHGSALRPVDLRALAPGADGGSRAMRGRQGRLRLLDGAGALLGLAEPRADGLLHPVLVLV